jgi:hypothetical protein
VVDDFNMWWVVVYGRVTGDWKADGDRKWKSCDWSDTKVLTAPIALTLKDKMKCGAILCNFVQFWPCLAVLMISIRVVVYGQVRWDRKADGDRKWKSCDWSDTKVLTAPIALTLIVKMNCSAISALLSCG